MATRSRVLDRVLSRLGSFENSVVLVTGASSGIGRETALTFARAGASVALAARRRDRLHDVAAEVERAGGQALVVPTDVGDPRSARACVAEVRRRWQRIDCLINSAGILVPSTVGTLPVEALETMLRVNVFGALLMVQAVLPLMQRQEHGSIVNIGSLAGRRGLTPLGGYCATKFALIGLTEALRTEVDAAQLHVGIVLPGVVDTPMAQSVSQDALLKMWPAALNMPAQWVAAAVMLAVRFRLREISVPPGAATLEILGALAPGLTDMVIAWGRSAGALLARGR